MPRPSNLECHFAQISGRSVGAASHNSHVAADEWLTWRGRRLFFRYATCCLWPADHGALHGRAGGRMPGIARHLNEPAQVSRGDSCNTPGPWIGLDNIDQRQPRARRSASPSIVVRCAILVPASQIQRKAPATISAAPVVAQSPCAIRSCRGFQSRTVLRAARAAPLLRKLRRQSPGVLPCGPTM